MKNENTLKEVVPKLQADQPHAGTALEAAAFVFLFRQCSCPSGPIQGDHSANFLLALIFKWQQNIHTIQTG